MSISTSCYQSWQLGCFAFPATSAPSEHVFSVTGLIIAKDRARLASDTANELIFFMMPCLGLENILNNYTIEAGSSREEVVMIYF
jgi:hypothetical protein